MAAKAAPGGVQLFNPALESRSMRRLGLAADLRRALDNDELEVYFQPKVTLTDRAVGGGGVPGPLGASRARRRSSPEDFVAGRRAHRPARPAHRDGDPGRAAPEPGLGGPGHPLNVVGQPLRPYADRPGVPGPGAGAAGRVRGCRAERLTLEIREAGVLDGTDRPMPTLRRLRDIGVRLSVDDFGTGYSSLSYLRRLPVHEVKVDQSFVQGMATDPVDLAIVSAVVTSSQQFGLAVVAEGVESELTLELLQDIGLRRRAGLPVQPPAAVRAAGGLVRGAGGAEPRPTGDVRRLRAVTLSRPLRPSGLVTTPGT